MTRLILLATIYWQSAMHGVHPELATAVVFVESSFRPSVRCGNCVGLMQINVPIWEKALNLDPKRMTEVNYNLCAGLTILRHYYEMTKDVGKALQFYNCGPSGKYKSDYVGKVKRAYKLFYGGAAWEKMLKR